MNFATARPPKRTGVLGPWKQFEKKYKIPIVKARGKNASRHEVSEGEKATDALKELVEPYILRRLRKDHLKLPVKEDFVVFVKHSSRQHELMEAEIEQLRTWAQNRARPAS